MFVRYAPRESVFLIVRVPTSSRVKGVSGAVMRRESPSRVFANLRIPIAAADRQRCQPTPRRDRDEHCVPWSVSPEWSGRQRHARVAAGSCRCRDRSRYGPKKCGHVASVRQHSPQVCQSSSPGASASGAGAPGEGTVARSLVSSMVINSSQPVNATVWPCSSVKRPSIGCRSRSTSSWKRRRCRSISAKCGRRRAWPRRGGPCTRPLGSVLSAIVFARGALGVCCRDGVR